MGPGSTINPFSTPGNDYWTNPAERSAQATPAAPAGGFDVGSLFGISPANAANAFAPGEQIMDINVQPQPAGQTPSLGVPGSTPPSTLRAIADENQNVPSPLVGPNDFVDPSFNPNAPPSPATSPNLIGGAFNMNDPALTQLSSPNALATSPPGFGPVSTVDPSATQMTLVPDNTVSNTVIPGAKGAPPAAFIGDQSQFNAIDAQAPPAPTPAPAPGPQVAGPGGQPSSPTPPSQGGGPVDLGTPTSTDVSSALANAPAGGDGLSDGGGGDGGGLARSITQPIPGTGAPDGTPPADGVPPFGPPPIGLEDINFGNINPEEGLFGPQGPPGGGIPPGGQPIVDGLQGPVLSAPSDPFGAVLPGGVSQATMANLPADDVNNALSNAGSV
jgi:hypothetical protein